MLLFGNEKKLVLLLQECFAHCGVRVVLFYEEKLPKVTPQKEEWLVRGYCCFANCNARRLWAPHVGLCLSFFLLPNSADFPPSPERLTSHIKAVVQILTMSCKKPFECSYFQFREQSNSIVAENENYRLAVF